MNKNALAMIAIVIVIVAGVLGLAFWLNSVSPAPVTPDGSLKGEAVFTRDYSHMTGKAGAKVTLVEFGDYQCPFCAESYLPVKQVVDKYAANPDFNFVFRNFPLSQHQNAQISAEAAEAAGTQGKYFEMMGLLYAHQNDWAGSIDPTGSFRGFAQQLSLDLDKFITDVKASKFINEITQDELDGEALGVNSTPTFFLNGKKVDGYTQLDSLIKALLVPSDPKK